MMGQLLVAFRDVALCDGGQHETTVTTDGRLCIAEGPNGEAVPAVTRAHATLQVPCPVEGCHGVGYVHLDAPGGWTTYGPTVQELADYGTETAIEWAEGSVL